MSALLTGEVYKLDLPHEQQSVLLALADESRDDGLCRPGKLYLEWKTGYAERHIQRILKQLEKKNLLKRLTSARGGRGLASEYKLTLGEGAKKIDYHKWKAQKLAQKKDAKEAAALRKAALNSHPQTETECPSLSDSKQDKVSPFNEQGKRDILSPFPQKEDTVTSPFEAEINDQKGDTGVSPPVLRNVLNTHTPPAPSEGVRVEVSESPPSNGGSSPGSQRSSSQLSGSRFTLEEREAHALEFDLRGGWLTLSADGRYDDAIEFERKRRARREQPPAPVDIRECPDCRGSTFKPSASGSGVTKCKHERLLPAATG